MNNVSLKVYLVNENLREVEVRRFNVHSYVLTEYASFAAEISDVFPEVAGKLFTIYWKDEENDNVVVSSNEELILAVNEMKSDVKKFFVKVRVPTRQGDGKEVDDIHEGIICDGCNGSVIGYRYKCLACGDYDLCSECEQASLHSHHPMLRIPNPFLFDKIDLYRVVYCISKLFVPSKFGMKHSQHRRRHSRDHSHSHKKRMCDRHDSGPETGEEFDEKRSRKHSHKRGGCQKAVIDSKRVQETQTDLLYSPDLCGTLMSELLKNLDPAQFLKEEKLKTSSQERVTGETNEETTYVKNMKYAVKTILSLLKSLGIDADFEIRSGTNAEKTQKERTENPVKEEQAETAAPSPSAPSEASVQTPAQPKEVRFATQEQESENLKQSVEQIIKMLANQGINQSPENDGWVSFEELKRESEEPEPSTSADTTSEVWKTKEPTPQAEKATEESKTIYPTLKSEEETHTSPVVREALEKMLAMGFTNEGNWLAHLLKVKNGNII